MFPNGGPTHIRAHHLPDKALQEKAITEAHALAARVDVIEHDTAKKARKYLRYVQREYRKEVGEDMGDDGDDGEE